ncbi:hypothetical protein Q73_11870 [Bacillus coahuilensis m2-6]|nr:hypothetical protein Q73_11870 [Bacillus coahuilensis m2-6]
MPLNQLSQIHLYQQILDNINVGVHAIDSYGKTILYNRRMAEIEGMIQAEVVDKDITEVFSFLDESTLLKALQTKEAILHYKQTYFNSKGLEITTINSTYPVEEDGKVIGVVEIATDVTKLENLVRDQWFKKEEAAISFHSIIGKSLSLQKMVEYSKSATKYGFPILIIGERGTGKELLAQTIHQQSNRKKAGFIRINPLDIPTFTLEEILQENSSPLIDEANGGTVLIENIHMLTNPLQEILLQNLKNPSLNIQFIATLTEDPIEMIGKGALRKDLYYELSRYCIFLPSLRERKIDFEELIPYFIQKNNHLFGTRVGGIDEEVHEIFLGYEWPGNVRELEHTLEECFHYVGDQTTITFEHLPLPFREKVSTEPSQPIPEQESEPLHLDQYLAIKEKQYIKQGLVKNEYNITKTAKELGMSRQNLQYRMKKHHIDRR